MATVMRSILTDAGNWPWSGERNFKKYQISEVHFEAIRDIVFRQGKRQEPNVEPVQRLEPAPAMDPSDRKRRARQDRNDPEEDAPSALAEGGDDDPWRTMLGQLAGRGEDDCVGGRCSAALLRW